MSQPTGRRRCPWEPFLASSSEPATGHGKSSERLRSLMSGEEENVGNVHDVCPAAGDKSSLRKERGRLIFDAEYECGKKPQSRVLAGAF